LNITVSIIFLLSSVSSSPSSAALPFFDFFLAGEFFSPLPPLVSFTSHILFACFKSLDFLPISWLLDLERDFDLLLLLLSKKGCNPWLTFKRVVSNCEIERIAFESLFLQSFPLTFGFFYLFEDF
jgi:hypothetical protein